MNLKKLKNENKPIIKNKLTPEINTVAIQLPIKILIDQDQADLSIKLSLIVIVKN